MKNALLQGTVFFRYVVIVNVVLLLAMTRPYAQQQTEDSEHASHHPEETNESLVGVSTDALPLATQGKGPPGNAMMGPGMAKGMDKMMEKMGAPKPKDLYPTLMRMHSTTPEQREIVLRKATARMQQGSTQLATGFDWLARAAAADDFTQMQVAVETVKEGIAHFDSGLAAKRAIQDGQEPRRVALTWFKSQMNLLPSAPANDTSTLFGMTPFHTAVMLVLLLFTVVMVYVYGFKMRRAAALLAQLKSTETASGPASTHKAAANDIPITTPIPQKDSASAPTRESALALPTAAPRKGVFTGDVVVTGIFNETHDVKTFRLASPDGHTIPFSFEPGQFVTFTLTIDGVAKPVKRSYTIASSPTEHHYFEVTIKREEFGVVSRYIHDTVHVGDALTIKAPGGKFYFNGQAANSVVLISGGVGITPMMSAVRYLTTTCWDGDIYFLFCTRTSNDFIFEQELKYLQARHPRLKVLVSMTQAKGTSWMGPQGRFSSALINEFVPDIASKTAHICGPPAMMDATKDMLSELGMPEAHIKTEAFGGASPKKTAAKPEVAPNTPVKNTRQVRFSLSNAQAQAGPDETVLDVADGLDVDIENSCRAGSCGSCKVKLLRGDVDMEVDDGLEPEDKVSGYILACQAIPKPDVEVEA